MPPAHAPSSTLHTLSREVAEADVAPAYVEAGAHGVPMTSDVLEAMNVFATTGAFATLLLVAAVTLAWRSTVQDSFGVGVLGGAVLAAALALFVQGRAKLMNTFVTACTDAGLSNEEAQRRARAALRHALPRRSH